MIAIGSDHAGFSLKNEIAIHLAEAGYKVKDYGTYGLDSVDYSDYGLAVAEAVKDGTCEKGILICGTGIGMSITANKVPGIRAAVCTNSYMARFGREHNDSNVLALGARVIGTGLAFDIVDEWVKTEFLGGRHKLRIYKISDIERKYSKE